MKTIRGDDKLEARQSVFGQLKFVLLGAAAILLVPLIAAQLTDAMAWSVFDFALAGALLVGTGVAYVLGARMVSKLHYRAALAVVLALALLFAWLELAVGIIGTPFAGT